MNNHIPYTHSQELLVKKNKNKFKKKEKENKKSY